MVVKYTNELLKGICAKLQLQPNKYQLANERYHTIADIIERDNAFKGVHLQLYPHGSFRLKTTVKPLQSNEYDLDFVVEIPSTTKMNPRELYDHVARILSSDGNHQGMVEKKTRCIRVNYSNDFHMDIMPGQSIGSGTTEIIVPDKELKAWYHHSNPKAYAMWFEMQAKTNINAEMSALKKAAVEPLTEQEMALRLEPLRQAVQLIKRYRDVYCDAHDKTPVRSIVICTLMGYISSSYSNTIDIIGDFCTYVNGRIAGAFGEPFEVRNPVVDEVLTEKWKESKSNYTDFVAMMAELTSDVKRLQELSVNTDISTLIKKMFGESITTEVIKENSQGIANARATGKLAAGANGLLSTEGLGTAVRSNHFYGED